ncbi:hypothetical protein [Streptomyces sp. NPDC048002]|uniref:hypothetical protein n=1 Tax=Streptomyces sp. NPDC048002 TaxID=3154344 RepID=UPI0033CB1418
MPGPSGADATSTEAQLTEHGINPASLPSAPAQPTRRQFRDRVTAVRLAPCALCGEAGAATRVIPTAAGPCWLDLCWPHVRTLTRPSTTVPDTLEGVLADLHRAIEESETATGVRLPVLLWTDNAGDREA